MRFGIAISVLVSVTACSKSPAGSASKVDAQPAAAVPPALGRLVGRAPRPNPGAFVIVLLEPEAPREFPPQTDMPVMDQIALPFAPDVLFVRTGQPVAFLNSDETLHNINVQEDATRTQAFNVALPTAGSYKYTFTRDGFYHVRCDIHPQMAAEIVATSTPYTTLADEEGRFAIEDVAPGAYRLTVWARGNKLQRDVDVKPGDTEVDLRGAAE